MTNTLRFRWEMTCKNTGKLDIHEAEEKVWIMVNHQLCVLTPKEAFQYAEAIKNAACLIEKRLADDAPAGSPIDNPGGVLLVLPPSTSNQGAVT